MGLHQSRPARRLISFIGTKEKNLEKLNGSKKCNLNHQEMREQ